MNYLAHIALSGSNEMVIIGNFIGDYVKGSDFVNYPKDIKKGILLHRAIDSFTDQHELVTKSKRLFYSEFPKVSGIILDILYDHFLCLYWNNFYEKDLKQFSKETYVLLEKHKHLFPQKMDGLYQHLVANDWFRRYETEEGTGLSLSQIGKRFNYPKDLATSFDVVQKNKELLHSYFNVFYDELESFCIDFIEKK